TFNEMIWYVNGSAPAGGNGTSVSPFNSFASLNGPGGVGDVDAPGAYICVHNSTVSGGIGLEQNQKLIGEGVGLTISAYTLVPAGTAPNIVAVGDAVEVAVTGTEVAGLNLSSSTGKGIDVTSAGLIASGASIHTIVISAGALEGIDVNAASSAGTTVSVNNSIIHSTGTGFDVVASGPAVVAFTNGNVTSTGGSGVHIDGTASGGNLFIPRPGHL